MKTHSKVVLGIVQLGLEYGLTNTHGKPSHDEAFSILDAAIAGGITTFDVAYAYGTAEDVLGAWIQERGNADHIRVISKMKPHALNDYPDGTKAEDVVRQEIEKSLTRLNLKTLDGYLLHSPHYVYLDHVITGLKSAKKAGLIQNIGVSTYDEPEALQALERELDYIQVPYNVLDQRLDQTVFFKEAKSHGVTVFARGPFLQGLLLMREENVPPHLLHARPHIKKFQEIIARYNLSPLEASLRFALEKEEADHVVVGVEQKSQLDEILKIAETPLKDEALVRELREAFKQIERAIVNPSLWSKIKK